MLVLGVSLLGLLLALVGLRRVHESRRMAADVDRALSSQTIGGTLADAAPLARGAKFLAGRPNGLAKAAQVVIGNGLRGSDAVFLLERFCRPRKKPPAEALRYLAQLYVEEGRPLSARRALDFLIASAEATPDDVDRRAGLAMAGSEASDYAISVCERSRSTTSPGLRAQLAGYLGAYYSAALSVRDGHRCDCEALAARARPVFEELFERSPDDMSHGSDLVLCHYLRHDLRSCHHACLRVYRLFGRPALDQIAGMWADALVEVMGSEGVTCASIASSCKAVDLSLVEYRMVLENAQQSTSSVKLVGPLASACARMKATDEAAVATYQKAVDSAAAETPVLELLLQALLRRENWDQALPVALELAHRVPSDERWSICATDLLQRLDKQELIDQHLAVVEGVFLARQHDPSYLRMLQAALLRRPTWDDREAALAVKLETAGGAADGQQLRQRMLRLQFDGDGHGPIGDALVSQILPRWWHAGGRSSEVVRLALRSPQRLALADSLLREMALWLTDEGEPGLDLISALLRGLGEADADRPLVVRLGEAAERCWDAKSEFGAMDADVFAELSRRGCRLSAASYEKCIPYMVDSGRTREALDLLGRFLGAGHYSRTLFEKMANRDALTSGSDLGNKVLVSLLQHGDGGIDAALRLLRHHGTGPSGPAGVDVAREKVVGAFDDPSVSDAQRREACLQLARDLLAKNARDLSRGERRLLVFAFDHDLLEEAGADPEEIGGDLCQVLLGDDPPEGLRLAKMLADRGWLSPDLALKVLEVVRP